MERGKMIDLFVEEVDHLRNFLKTCTDLTPSAVLNIDDFIGDWEKNLITKLVDVFEKEEKAKSDQGGE